MTSTERVVSDKPDLTCLFGQLTREENQILIDLMASVEADLSVFTYSATETGGARAYSYPVQLHKLPSGQIHIDVSFGYPDIECYAELRPGNFYGSWLPDAPPRTMDTSFWHVDGQLGTEPRL